MRRCAGERKPEMRGGKEAGDRRLAGITRHHGRGGAGRWAVAEDVRRRERSRCCRRLGGMRASEITGSKLAATLISSLSLVWAGPTFRPAGLIQLFLRSKHKKEIGALPYPTMSTSYNVLCCCVSLLSSSPVAQSFQCLSLSSKSNFNSVVACWL
jgi:hypothetical protein